MLDPKERAHLAIRGGLSLRTTGVRGRGRGKNSLQGERESKDATLVVDVQSFFLIVRHLAVLRPGLSLRCCFLRMDFLFLWLLLDACSKGFLMIFGMVKDGHCACFRYIDFGLYCLCVTDVDFELLKLWDGALQYIH